MLLVEICSISGKPWSILEEIAPLPPPGFLSMSMHFSPLLDGFVGGGGMVVVTEVEVEEDLTVGGEVWSDWNWSALLWVK